MARFAKHLRPREEISCDLIAFLQSFGPRPEPNFIRTNQEHRRNTGAIAFHKIVKTNCFRHEREPGSVILLRPSFEVAQLLIQLFMSGANRADFPTCLASQMNSNHADSQGSLLVGFGEKTGRWLEASPEGSGNNANHIFSKNTNLTGGFASTGRQSAGRFRSREKVAERVVNSILYQSPLGLFQIDGVPNQRV